MLEAEIFDRAALILQNNFSKYHDVNVCLLLNDADGDYCSVKSVRFFKIQSEADKAILFEFMFKGEYHKAYLMTKFKGGFYRMNIFGHFTHKTGDVYPHDVTDVSISRSETDKITWKRLPYEIILRGFQDISSCLINNKKKSS
jgi:hypothetical protein